MIARSKLRHKQSMVSPALPLAGPIWETDLVNAMTSTGSFALATLLPSRGSMRIWWHLSGWSSLPSPIYLPTKEQIQIHERVCVWVRKFQMQLTCSRVPLSSEFKILIKCLMAGEIPRSSSHATARHLHINTSFFRKIRAFRSSRLLSEYPKNGHDPHDECAPK